MELIVITSDDQVMRICGLNTRVLILHCSRKLQIVKFG
jgi:hypothetical protein